MIVSTRCCIAGGGPAGMMLGLLLARAGIDVIVLEKHADFLRDFRGDTIHPSTLRLMDELGLLEDLLKLPHQKVQRLKAQVGDATVEVADFTHLPARYAFIAMMPQWDFLDFLAARAKRYPSFALRMRTAATDLVEESGRIVGLRATGPEGSLELRADLVVGADGRHSLVREKAGLRVDELGAPMDVLWFRLSRLPGDPGDSMGRFDAGRIFVIINRGTHWQLGYVIPKGSIDEIRRQGLERFRETIAAMVPWARDRLHEVATWDDVKLLTVGVDRLRQWYRPGLLCIGDAAHTMSPVGGVGINLAIQDAVATANILVAPLRERRLTADDLRAVQRRREFPVRLTQAMQVAVQRRIISRVLTGGGGKPLPIPAALRLLARFPPLRRIPARLIGVGVRPEHVRTPAEGAASGPNGRRL